MAFGKIKVDTSVLEEKLKIAHKHIGAMLQELQNVCDECGSSNTYITKLNSDSEALCEIRVCKSCDNQTVVEVQKGV